MLRTGTSTLLLTPTGAAGSGRDTSRKDGTEASPDGPTKAFKLPCSVAGTQLRSWLPSQKSIGPQLQSGLALATYVTSAQRRYISFSNGLPVSERSAAVREEKKSSAIWVLEI